MGVIAPSSTGAAPTTTVARRCAPITSSCPWSRPTAGSWQVLNSIATAAGPLETLVTAVKTRERRLEQLRSALSDLEGRKRIWRDRHRETRRRASR